MTSIRSRVAAAILGAGLLVATPGVALGQDGERRERSERSRHQDFDRRDRDRSGAAAEPATPAEPARPVRPAAPARPAWPERGERHVGRMTEALRARCLAAIDRRIDALARTKAHLEKVKGLTDAHRDELVELLDGSTAGLGDLRDEIAAETDRAALRADCTSIFADFRIFALVLPRTHLVVASDMTVALADRLDEVADKLADAIEDYADANPDADLTDLEADLAAMRDRIDAGRATADDVPESILDLDAADWNADHAVLKPAREALRSARGDLADARRLAGEIRSGLDDDNDEVKAKEGFGRQRRSERGQAR